MVVSHPRNLCTAGLEFPPSGNPNMGTTNFNSSVCLGSVSFVTWGLMPLHDDLRSLPRANSSSEQEWLHVSSVIA